MKKTKPATFSGVTKRLKAIADEMNAVSTSLRVSTSDKEAAMRKLERELAYSAARSDIECACNPHTPLGHGVSWDTSNLLLEATVGLDEGQAGRIVTRAVAYLEWLGCIERLWGSPHIVTIKELS